MREGAVGRKGNERRKRGRGKENWRECERGRGEKEGMKRGVWRAREGERKEKEKGSKEKRGREGRKREGMMLRSVHVARGERWLCG